LPWLQADLPWYDGYTLWKWDIILPVQWRVILKWVQKKIYFLELRDLEGKHENWDIPVIWSVKGTSRTVLWCMFNIVQESHQTMSIWCATRQVILWWFCTIHYSYSYSFTKDKML
jgi:hypothetical protein